MTRQSATAVRGPAWPAVGQAGPTLVTTWPEKIARPGYWMDGVRWCAGFADEHSNYKGSANHQFGLSFGVSAGKHTIKIAEWEWPAMPPVAPRSRLSLVP